VGKEKKLLIYSQRPDTYDNNPKSGNNNDMHYLKYVPHTPWQIQLLVIVQVFLIIKLLPTLGPYLECHFNNKNMVGGRIVYRASPTATASHQGHVRHTSNSVLTVIGRLSD